MYILLRVVSLAVLCMIGALGYKIYQSQLNWSIEQKATVNAEAWLGHFENAVPDFETLIRTGQPDAAQKRALEQATAVLDVFRFKLFNERGELTMLSDSLGGDETTSDSLFSHNAQAASVLETGMAYIMVEDGTDKKARPDHYAEAYIPVSGDDGLVGVVEIYVDVTETANVTEDVFARISIILSGLIIAALAIPTFFWLTALRQRRKNEMALIATAEKQARLAREVRLIGDLNEWLQSSRSQTELFEMTTRFLDRLLPDCDGELYVYSNSRDTLIGCAAWGGAVPGGHIHPEDCWSLRRGRTYSFGQDEIAIPCAHADPDETRPYLCMPLLAHGETIGLLHLRCKSGSKVEDFQASRRLAQTCAEQISMAVANVRLRDELQDQSIRDPLTGLFNRRHLAETLRNHMLRATRGDECVALLSIDVDHFKKFNDTFGHDAGDMVLRAVGELLGRSTDGDEVACRPGGEEFMVVLPDTDTVEAVMRAEGIREELQRIAIRYGDRTLPSITASFGVAVSPADGVMPQDLMRAADEALYRAKAEGRNKVVSTKPVTAVAKIA